MKKNRVVLASTGILSVLSIVGCGFNGNTDMQTDSTVNCAKWDGLANQVGTPMCKDAVPLTNKNGLIASLKEAPKNFVPGGSKYEENKILVANYVNQIAPKTQATEIVSIKKLSDVLKEAGYADHLNTEKDKMISIPYYERDADKINRKTNIGNYDDLSGIKSLSGIDENSEYKVFGTLSGIVNYDENNAKAATGTVYVFTYKLAGSDQKYSALVTIPKNVIGKVPLMMYAHGGDSGISFRNMATILQNNLSKAIVAAPSFPGEPICSITTIGGKNSKNFQRSCADEQGNKAEPAVKAEGMRSPLDDDVNSFLGLHNAISKFAQGAIKVTEQNADSEQFKESLKTSLAFYSDIPLLKSIAGPQTIGAADSRGGATLMAAIGRTGIMLEQVLKGGVDVTQLAAMPKPALFSSAALYYAPSSMLIGSFRVLTQYMVSGSINETSSYNAFPMIPDMKNNRYFTNYRKAPVGQDQKELNELVGWLGASEVAFLAPYLSVGMQNWGANLGSIGDVLLNNNNVNATINKVFLDLLLKDKLVDGITENLFKYILVYLNDISDPNLNNGKSLLNYFADSLRNHKKENGAQCHIINKVFDPTSISDCSLYNIFVYGESFNKLLPIVTEKDIPALADLLDLLGDKEKGLSAFSSPESHKVKILLNIYGALKKSKINLEALPILIKYLSVSTISVSYKFDEFKNLPDSVLNKVNIKINNTDDNSSGSLNKLLANQDKIENLFPKLAEQLKPLLASIMAERKSSPGSIIFLHATQDTVVPYTQSVIAKSAMDTVFDSVYGTLFPGNPLIKNHIPALGSQLFSFQPDDMFYDVEVGSKTADGSVCLSINSDGSAPSNYNPNVNKCFGKHPLASNGDGIYCHGDSAISTSHLINGALQKLNYKDNKIDVQNSLLYGNNNFDSNKKIYQKAYETSLTDQLGTFNNYKKEDHYSTTCDSQAKTGVCYLANADRTDIFSPLFNRTIPIDGVYQKASMFEGGFDATAQASQMTPSDVFSAWMDSSVQKSLNRPK